MKAYYGSRFSKNMTKTPEGFLICHNAPIARTGWYEYLGEEIGANDKQGQIVKVFRSPEEVFSASAVASFNGKTVTNEHPNNLIDSNNNNAVDMGDVTNVRQGTGDESDLLLADLIIKDSTLVSAVEQGKREISCGYDCTYEDNGDGTYSQRQICGNHVAVVQNGRAGDRVAIKDSKIKDKEGEKNMAEKIQLPRKHSSISNFLQAIGFKKFATDAEPVDLMDALEDLQAERAEKEKSKDEETVKKEETVKDEVNPLEKKVAELEAKLAAYEKADKKDDSKDSIDAAIEELEAGSKDTEGDEEESQTVPAEEMGDDSLVPGVVLPEEERPKNTLPSSDSATMLNLLKEMKVAIASIEDPKARKQMTDSAMNIYKKSKKKTGKNGYADIIRSQKKNAAIAAKDSKATADARAAAEEKIGEDIKKQFNPHYKEVK